VNGVEEGRNSVQKKQQATKATDLATANNNRHLKSD
jgi:hypothetical protein